MIVILVKPSVVAYSPAARDATVISKTGDKCWSNRSTSGSALDWIIRMNFNIMQVFVICICKMFNSTLT